MIFEGPNFYGPNSGQAVVLQAVLDSQWKDAPVPPGIQTSPQLQHCSPELCPDLINLESLLGSRWSGS